jgi:hypothetical protein
LGLLEREAQVSTLYALKRLLNKTLLPCSVHKYNLHATRECDLAKRKHPPGGGLGGCFLTGEEGIQDAAGEFIKCYIIVNRE